MRTPPEATSIKSTRSNVENTAHFILQCASLQEVRKPFMDKILSYLETNENLTPYVTDLLEDQNMLLLDKIRKLYLNSVFV
jgi:hypothetical protein